MNEDAFKKTIDEAIKSEIEAQKFYQQAAERIDDSYLKEMFNEFVREEVRHQRVLLEIYHDETIRIPFDEERDYKVSETVELPEVADVKKPADAIAIAMKHEEMAMKQYENLADSCEDPDLKAVFQGLAAMEREHKHRMEQSYVDIAYPEVW